MARELRVEMQGVGVAVLSRPPIDTSDLAVTRCDLVVSILSVNKFSTFSVDRLLWASQ